MNQHKEDFIDLQDLLRYFWAKKILIVILVALISFSALIYSIFLPNIYVSKAILSPTQNENLNTSSSLGGLANIAGLNMQANSNTVVEAIEIIHSLKFFEDYFLSNIFLPDLMAVDKWDKDRNQVYYDSSLYNLTEKVWVGGETNDEKLPSIQSSHAKFLKNHLVLERDRQSGLVKISMKHESPHIAKDWLEKIIIGINTSLRLDQQKRSSISLKYLNQQLLDTNLSEIKQALSNLIKQETEKLMLTESNQDYVFRVLDPPYAPEVKSEPNRFLILLYAALFSLIFGSLVIFTRYLQKR